MGYLRGAALCGQLRAYTVFGERVAEVLDRPSFEQS